MSYYDGDLDLLRSATSFTGVRRSGRGRADGDIGLKPPSAAIRAATGSAPRRHLERLPPRQYG